MRVVLYNDRKPERDAMVRLLAAASHQLEGVSDEASAIAAIGREAPAMVIFSAPAKGGADLVRRLKGADTSGQAYLLAVVDSAPASRELASLLEAGANDFFRRPLLEVELMERLKAPSRIVRWVRSLAGSTVFDLSAPVDVSRLQAWLNLGSLVAGDLSEMAGHTFAVASGWPRRFVHGLRSAHIPMSLPGDQLEVRISIVVDAVTLRWVKAALLGDPNSDAAAADDALRELANTAGGVMKRAALAENVSLTTGIPATHDFDAPRPEHACFTLSLDGEECCIALVGSIHQRANQRVAAGELVEGMILAHDVRNEGGILLVPGGSRLTSTTAAKLAKMLGPRFFLEVAPAA